MGWPAKKMIGLTVKSMRNKVGWCLFKSVGLHSKKVCGRKLDVFPPTQVVKVKIVSQSKRPKKCESKD